MIYCKDLSFCFIAVPKTGTTSIETFISSFCDENDIAYIKSEAKNVPYTNPTGKHASLQAIKQHYGILPKTKIIGFVRNPWDKVVSWYQYLKLNKSSSYFIQEDISFTEFLNSAPNFVFTESYKFLTTDSNNIGVDFLGRFETIESDFQRLCDFLHIEWSPLLKLNQSSKSLHYSAFYDEQARKYIQNRFINDIAIFDYKFNKI